MGASRLRVNERLKKISFYVYTINGQTPCHLLALNVKRNLNLIE